MHYARNQTRSQDEPPRPARKEPDFSAAKLVPGLGGNRAAVALARAVLARWFPARPRPEPVPNDLVAAARQLVADWATLADPMARAQRLGAAVNELLRAGDAPPVDISFEPPPDAGPLESLGGHLDSGAPGPCTWTGRSTAPRPRPPRRR
jgi:hypothetical protein